MRHGESHIAARERHRREGLLDGAPFAARALHELVARGRVEEQLLDRDGRAAPARGAIHRLAPAAHHAHPGAGSVGGCGLDLKSRHRPDCRQRLAAETEAGDAHEILRLPDLRGGVPFHGERGVVALHAVAVVRDAHQRAPAFAPTWMHALAPL